MDSTVSPRLVTSVLALLFCLVASLRVGEVKVKPVRMVTEVVAIAMVNPRVAKAPLAGDPAAGVMHLAASGAEGDAIAPAPVQPSPAPERAQKSPATATTGRPAPTAPRPRPEAKPATQVARAAARPHAGARAHARRVHRPALVAQAAPASTEVPALFVPLRSLGLSIQARLPVQRAGTAPPAKPPEPCGPTAV